VKLDEKRELIRIESGLGVTAYGIEKSTGNWKGPVLVLDTHDYDACRMKAVDARKLANAILDWCNEVERS